MIAEASRATQPAKAGGISKTLSLESAYEGLQAFWHEKLAFCPDKKALPRKKRK